MRLEGPRFAEIAQCVEEILIAVKTGSIIIQYTYYKAIAGRLNLKLENIEC